MSVDDDDDENSEGG